MNFAADHLLDFRVVVEVFLMQVFEVPTYAHQNFVVQISVAQVSHYIVHFLLEYFISLVQRIDYRADTVY